MRRFQTTDGYIFYEQPDGTMTDHADPELADLLYTNLAELQAEHDVKELPE
jgi:hypothetical protein